MTYDSEIKRARQMEMKAAVMIHHRTGVRLKSVVNWAEIARLTSEIDLLHKKARKARESARIMM